ncbi:alpha/beta hydrolase [Phenylobacterium kunshanense]|uniref:Alpha/beta hydrolase n=1 Tax=Phenylobacterium kunshanense TaxID=1445034 RepID=A0A328BMD6_9CAUL|nr:alpha/beta hydrolase [Phenylobacterium kunshanense]RAK67699.1 alpha/beta hydrolase [Phenylobacterium kunshanense]
MASAAVQRFVARTILSLPSPLLRLMSGGAAVYRAGRTLDPRLQFLAHQARNQPPMDTLSPEEARRGETQAISAVTGDLEPGVRWEPLNVPGQVSDVPARLYRPEPQDPSAPMMVWAHMGGGVIGSLDTSHCFAALLARITRGPVLSVDYRLAPEHRFPAGFEDVLGAYRWARNSAEHYGATGVAIGGDSMGGNFAAILCQELKRLGEPQPRMQLLVYPCTDVASESESMTVFGDAFPLNRAMMDWFMGHYLGPDDDPASPRLSPLREKDLTGLAPAVIATAGFDPLVDQGEAYAKALKAAGVTVRYRCYDSLTHAFAAFTGAIPAADAACREIAGLVRDTYEETRPA